MFDTLTERSKHGAGDAYRLANLPLRVAGVLVTAALVFAALFLFVRALE